MNHLHSAAGLLAAFQAVGSDYAVGTDAREKNWKMPARRDVTGFIRSTFRSVWALELMCFLRREPDREWRRDELVTALRSSDPVIDQSLAALTAAGLVVMVSRDSARYQPANQELDALARAAEAQYASSPDKVRRLIVSSTHGGLSAFADAFRVRRD